MKEETIVYVVQIIDANPGAWYRFHMKEQYKCVLNEQQFLLRKIEKYRVLNSTLPVRYIKKDHVKIISQRVATHAELSNKNGTNTANFF